MKKPKTHNHSSWKLTYKDFVPAEENLREALCTLGNGYFGTRAASMESSVSRIHYPGTYVAGVYNKTPTHIAGRTIFNEDFVNCPNWLYLSFRIGDGEWITPSTGNVLSYRQELDIHRGVLTRSMRIQDREGRKTTVKAQMLVHMQNPHIGAIKYVITPENYAEWIIVRSALDGTVQNRGVPRYRQLNSKHLKGIALGGFGKNGIYLSMKTSQSNITISQASRLRIFKGGRELKPVSRILKDKNKKICQEFALKVSRKKHYEIEKIVSIYTSKDELIKNPLSATINSMKTSYRFKSLLKTHTQAWELLWRRFDIQIEGDQFSQKVLRLHTFHLLQAASVHNSSIDGGLPARGLHGEAYRGHIFWDEVFVMSFFDLHTPQTSKALLLYRYNRLSKAREYAKENGYKGAMFPWQSGSTGEEETQSLHLNPMSGKWGPDYSRIQRHVSFAIAYNVWQHWKYTRDIDFLVNYGAEMILSIAQFGASLSKYSRKDKRYHTEGIMGPDEFHERFPNSDKPGFKDNAYTNLLIAWTLIRAQEIASILPRDTKDNLFKKLHLKEQDLLHWENISQKMNIIFNNDGIISQFDGYFKLKELDWASYRAKYGKIQRMDRILKSEGKSPNEYKIAKQADVLMMFYHFPLVEIKDIFRRLGYKFTHFLLKKNYEYYIKRTSHGSTLSRVAHCYVAYLLARYSESWKYFLDILRSDIYDTQGGTTPEGIHVGVMGGSINIAMRHFAGIEILKDKIKVEPSLPKKWRSMKLRFFYREKWIALSITKKDITILVHGPESKIFNVPFEVNGKLHHLVFGKAHNVFLSRRK